MSRCLILASPRDAGVFGGSQVSFRFPGMAMRRCRQSSRVASSEISERLTSCDLASRHSILMNSDVVRAAVDIIEDVMANASLGPRPCIQSAQRASPDAATDPAIIHFVACPCFWAAYWRARASFHRLNHLTGPDKVCTIGNTQKGSCSSARRSPEIGSCTIR